MFGVNSGWYLALLERLPALTIMGITVTSVFVIFTREAPRYLSKSEFDKKFELEFGGYGPTLGTAFLGIVGGRRG